MALALRGFKSSLGKLGSLTQGLSAIAVDFGTTGVKALQVVNGEAPSLVAAAFIPTPESLWDNPRARLLHQFELLPRLLRSPGFKGKRVVCSIPAGQTFCKHLQIPKAEGVETAPLVEGALAAQLNADPASLIFRHYEVGAVAQGAKLEVIGLAVGREVVQKMMGAIKTCRFDPVGMHGEFHATLRAFEYLNRRADDANLATIYLDIGAATTKVSIGHGKELVFSRCIHFGGRQLDEAVARQFRCDLGEAARIRREAAAQGPAESARRDAAAPDSNVSIDRRTGEPAPGTTPVAADEAPPPAATAAPGVNITEPLEVLTDELAMCLRYYESIFPGKHVERAIFIGGEARHRSLCQHVARRLKVAAQTADPLARLARTGSEPAHGVDLTEPQPGWTVALGLCLSPTDL